MQKINRGQTEDIGVTLVNPVARTQNPVFDTNTIFENIDALDEAIGADPTSTVYIDENNTISENIATLDQRLHQFIVDSGLPSNPNQVVITSYTVSTGGGPVAAYDIVGVDASGDVFPASNDSEELSRVVGVSLDPGIATETVRVQKIGLVSGFSGLVTGDPVYLGDNGAVVQDIALVGANSWKVLLGYAVSATEIDFNVHEPELLGSGTTTTLLAGEPIAEGNVVAATTFPVEEGLQIYYDFQFNSGTSVGDKSGNSFNGTNNGATYVPGVDNQLIDEYYGVQLISGDSDYINVGNNTSLQITGNITIGIWVINPGVSFDGRIITKSDDSTQKSWELNYSASMSEAYPEFIISSDGSADSVTVTTTKNVADGDWHHIVATYDGVNAKVFIDGVEEGTQAYASGIFNSTSDVSIGSYSGGSGFTDITVGETFIASRVYGLAEIQDLAAKEEPILEAELELYYDFTEQSGVTVTDESNNTNIGSFQGTPLWILDASGNALSFNGTTDYVDINDGLPAGDASVSFWFNAAKTSTQRIIYIQNSGDDPRIISIESDDSILFTTQAADGTTDRTSTAAAGTWTADEWTHVVAVQDGVDTLLYINGTLEDSDTHVDIYTGFTNTGILGRNLVVANHYDGLLDEFEVYNRAITQDEVSVLYRLGTEAVAKKASKRNETRIETLGFATNTAGVNEDVIIQKIGTITSFSGLSPGLPVFLGNDGRIIQDDDLVKGGEYRVFLGIAISETNVDVLLSEPVLNNPSDSIVMGQGTSFPSGALFGQEFYRTDLDEWYKYNGTVWTQI